LDEVTLKKIQYTMDNFKIRKYATTLSDLYRLALISKHGGVYLDASFVLFDDLEWIVNIGRLPSQYVYNRFGHLPKCLIYWGIQEGAPINW
jgi:mannosyltransferase OCH1-like enzyme